MNIELGSAVSFSKQNKEALPYFQAITVLNEIFSVYLKENKNSKKFEYLNLTNNDNDNNIKKIF